MSLFINTAHAAAASSETATAGNAFMLNMLLILILVVLFYFLLILPQQKRFKKHQQMLDGLKKGDKVLTAGGFIGKVHKINQDQGEVVVDLGNDIKVTAVRSTIQNIVNDKKK